MERVLVGRQPIFSADMREFAYALLYRNNDEDRAVFSDGDQATAELILNTFEIGLEELVGKSLAVIHFDRNRILSDHCQALPWDRVVLKLAGTTTPDEILLRRLAELAAKGYRIAIDGSKGGSGCGSFRALMEAANYVRFDLTTHSWDEIERLMGMAQTHPVQWIAAGVETQEQFERAKALKCDFFQGYFFGKPETKEARRVSVSRLSTLRMVAALNNAHIRIHDVEMAVSRDARLTYKFLRYANSVMCGLERPVDSIKQAMVLIGLEKIRIWASLLLLYGFENKEPDLIITGTVRDRMCEQLAGTQALENPDKLFLAGLFSILEAIVDQPLDGTLASIPLSPALADALVHQKGELGAVLKCVLEYDRKDWVDARSGVKLSKAAIRQAYVDAVGWSLRTLDGVPSQTIFEKEKSPSG